jgi:AcrR family transcriptional regulator
VTDGSDSIVDRTARRTLARRHAVYTDEVRRLLDAGLAVMKEAGTTKSPRVSDIVESAGLHREAFYRHFPSKQDLVAAIIEAGTDRLVSYLAHQMSKESRPQEQLRRWVEGIMAQSANPEVAASTRAVLWNGNSGGDHQEILAAHNKIGALTVEPIRALGRTDPFRDAAVLCEAVMGRQQQFLWECAIPTTEDIQHLVQFCLAAIGPVPKGRPLNQRQPSAAPEPRRHR